MERLLHRDGVSKTSVALSFSYKGVRSYLEEDLVQVGTRNQSMMGLRLAHSRRALSGVVAASLSYEAGLRAFGSFKDDPETPEAPKAQFKKWVGSLSYLRPFRLFDQSFEWQSELHGQWTEDNLYGTEQISLGGAESVRGFWDQTLSGDVGGYWRNELSWRAFEGQEGNVFQTGDLFTGLDWGWTRKDASNPYEGGHLQGIVIGGRARGESFFMTLSWEKSLQRPTFFNKENRAVRFHAGLRF